MSGPQHLLDAWDEVSAQLAQRERVALLSDFDGTLAAIRRRPADVRLADATRRLLAACAQRRVLVGIVSGRRLSDVRGLVGVRGIWYAGVHGYFLVSPDNRRFTEVYRTERERITRVQRQLQLALASEARIWVEPKGASVAVHYRGASRGSIRRAEKVVQSLLAGRPGLRLLPGRKIWEVLPAGRVDKWRAVRFITRRSRRRPQTLVFLGDDAGDECAFERMRGISGVVGRRRHTAARFWLRSPSEVRQFLKRCLRLWK